MKKKKKQRDSIPTNAEVKASVINYFESGIQFSGKKYS